MSYYKEQLCNFLKEQKLVAGSVLSVGNMHDDLKYFKESDILDIKTVDIDSQYSPDFIHDFNDRVDFLPSQLIGMEFDCILAFELFEYIWDPVQCFKNFYLLLKDGGQLWLSVPFLYPHHNPAGMDYLRATEWGIKKILEKTGFKIDIFWYRNWKDKQFWDMAVAVDGMRPSKEYPHHACTGFIIKATKND